MGIVLGAVVLVVAVAVTVMALRRPRGGDLHSVQSYHTALGTLEHLAERTGQPPTGAAGQAERGIGSPTGPRSYRRPGAPAVAPPGAPPVVPPIAEPSAAAPSDVEPAATVRPDDRSPGTVRPFSGAPAGGLAAVPPPTGLGRHEGGGDRGTEPSGAVAPGGVPPLPVRGNDRFPDPEKPLVFDDARPVDRVRPEVAEEVAQPYRVDRASKSALDSMNRRPRRASAALIVVAALVLFGGLAYVGSRQSHHADTSHATTHATTGTVPATTRPGHSGTTTPPGHHNSHDGGSKGPTSTTTTAPVRIVATSTTGSSAVYTVASTTYQVTVTASGPVWIDATSIPSGSTLWTGTLQNGGVQVIRASGTVSVELGSPDGALTVGPSPVVFPTPMHTPFVATFQPAAPGATTAPTGSTAPATAPAG